MKITKTLPLEGLGEELTRIPDAIRAAADEALNLQQILMLAKAFCPVASGALRDSIRVERSTNIEAVLAAGGLEYINTFTGKPVDYARAVHDGTSRMAPRPFLLQALQAERDRLAQEMALGSVARL